MVWYCVEVAANSKTDWWILILLVPQTDHGLVIVAFEVEPSMCPLYVRKNLALQCKNKNENQYPINIIVNA